MGESKHDGLVVPGRVVLAHERPFTLGELRVDPPTRQVERGARRGTLEPRVMQVLVALARTDGGIVTRDELVERCWGGRIVTDDAINRVLSRIRHVAEDEGGGSFAVETITKVGYRLVEHSATELPGLNALEPIRRAAKTFVSRRTVITGAASVGVATVAAGLLWQEPWAHRPPAAALELFRRGDLAQRDGTHGQSRQSVAYFERAVAIDPLYAEAWGALALAYSHLLDSLDESELKSMPVRIRSAADRALQLQTGNADAQLALISIEPWFRNWAAKERELRGFCSRYPRHWLGHGRLAMLLYQVGRLNDGIEFHRKMVEIDSLIPGPYASLASAMSSAGRIQEADVVLRQGHDRWPAHPLLWVIKYNHLLFGGRPQSAASFVVNPETLPSDFGPVQVDPRLRLARAVETGQRQDVEASLQHQLRMNLVQPLNIPSAAVIFALLGRLDLTFSSLERYYFNRGPFGLPAPITRLTRRHTNLLFTLPMAAARADPRFLILLRDVGLEEYWRASRTGPDFRRKLIRSA